MTAVEVQRLGKAYKIYPHQRARLKEWVLPMLGVQHKLRWALHDVSFRLAAGEAMGVIGGNGAGKSTLLKLIMGTARPTTGEVRSQGRVAGLLELGTGFHPELSGRQNVFMAGQLLGIRVDDIKALMPQVVAFADIGEEIDAPLRVYSSGMIVRLAFAISTAVRPDVFVVDEALSVGDAAFRSKSFDRLARFRKEGTSLLVASHELETIESLCDRAMLIDNGRLARVGDAQTVCQAYDLKAYDLMSSQKQRQQASEVET